MFTGLIEDIGTITQKVQLPTALRLSIATHFSLFTVGESISVDGVCLTVEEFFKNVFTCYASIATLSCTKIGDLQRGSRVHLEKALTPQNHLGGHFVTGHVDTVGFVTRKERLGSSLAFCIQPQDTVNFATVVAKGSVALDGVSLTITKREKASFWVTIIPETQKQTLISSWQVGTKVNIEFDILGKYVQQVCKESKGITRDFLEKHGFL